MTEVGPNICRLCMDTRVEKDIMSDKCLYMKISSCLNIKLQLQHGLPSMICSRCEKIINDFYEYKNKCAEVDIKLRIMHDKTKIEKNEDSCLDFEKDIMNIDMRDKDALFSDDIYICNDIMEYKEDDIKVYETENSFDTVNNIDKIKYNDIKEVRPNRSEFKDGKHNNLYISILQCEYCGKTFKNKTGLTQHLTSHSDVKPYSCDICNKTFTRKEHKIVHVRSHFGSRPFVCSTCGKASAKRQDLIRHMIIHSDEKKFSCPRCDRKFKRSADVHSHMRSHTGFRPYCCEVCFKSYSSHSTLVKHYKNNCRKVTKLK